MKKTLFHHLLIAAIALGAPHTATLHAQEDELERMRSGLRDVMIQLRDANNRIAIVEAEKAAADAAIAELENTVKLLTQQAITDKEAADKALATMQERAAEQDVLIGTLKVNLDKWQQAQRDAAKAADQRGKDLAAAKAKGTELQQRIDNAMRVNSELYGIGREILLRYEKFGLGDAVLSREKFIGITRTKFENLMQDYSDQLDDHKLKMPETPEK